MKRWMDVWVNEWINSMFVTHTSGVRLAMEEELEQSPKDHSKTFFTVIKNNNFYQVPAVCQLPWLQRDIKYRSIPEAHNVIKKIEYIYKEMNNNRR